MVTLSCLGLGFDRIGVSSTFTATNRVTVSSKKKLKWRSQTRFHHLEISMFRKPFGQCKCHRR